MVFLGMFESMPSGLNSLSSSFDLPLPKPFGTFVVSHNYGLVDDPMKEDPHGCGSPGDPGHPAKDGLNNLEKYSLLDHPKQRCYDTAPFRDRKSYDGQYIQMFEARGKYFMGCQLPMADDPTDRANCQNEGL
jgi:hypothetical protein